MALKTNNKQTRANPQKLEPPADITTGGEPGQTDEERREWKDVLREEAEDKAAQRARPKKASK